MHAAWLEGQQVIVVVVTCAQTQTNHATDCVVLGPAHHAASGVHVQGPRNQ